MQNLHSSESGPRRDITQLVIDLCQLIYAALPSDTFERDKLAIFQPIHNFVRDFSMGAFEGSLADLQAQIATYLQKKSFAPEVIEQVNALLTTEFGLHQGGEDKLDREKQF